MDLRGKKGNKFRLKGIINCFLICAIHQILFWRSNEERRGLVTLGGRTIVQKLQSLKETDRVEDLDVERSIMVTCVYKAVDRIQVSQQKDQGRPLVCIVIILRVP